MFFQFLGPLLLEFCLSIKREQGKPKTIFDKYKKNRLPDKSSDWCNGLYNLLRGNKNKNRKGITIGNIIPFHILTESSTLHASFQGTIFVTSGLWQLKQRVYTGNHCSCPYQNLKIIQQLHPEKNSFINNETCYKGLLFATWFQIY